MLLKGYMQFMTVVKVSRERHDPAGQSPGLDD